VERNGRGARKTHVAFGQRQEIILNNAAAATHLRRDPAIKRDILHHRKEAAGYTLYGRSPEAGERALQARRTRSKGSFAVGGRWQITTVPPVAEREGTTRG
jgi:hypothetical protein